MCYLNLPFPHLEGFFFHEMQLSWDDEAVGSFAVLQCAQFTEHADTDKLIFGTNSCARNRSLVAHFMREKVAYRLRKGKEFSLHRIKVKEKKGVQSDLLVHLEHLNRRAHVLMQEWYGCYFSELVHFKAYCTHGRDDGGIMDDLHRDMLVFSIQAQAHVSCCAERIADNKECHLLLLCPLKNLLTALHEVAVSKNHPFSI